jgi:Xaa-Pro aminopeptidase
MAVLIPHREEGEFILFNRSRDPAKEIWDGFRAGQEGAISEHGADEAHAIEEFYDMMPTLLEGKHKIYYQFGFEDALEDTVAMWINDARKKVRSGVIIPTVLEDVTALINDMRLIKSSAEIEVLRKAAAINVEAHTRAMQHCKPGMTESQLGAELNYVYNQHACWTWAYEPIVGSGSHACILHYRVGERVMQSGELVLVDAGQEYHWYASDITRTYPINGKFSAEQKAVYEAVLRVQLALLDMIKPGIPYNMMQETAIKLITQELITLGLLQGAVEENIKNKTYMDFYMHKSGHWMGLDVHDVSIYAVNGKWRELQPGMVLTVEPGIYISPKNMNVDKKWRGIGIRIEDDIVITEHGNENLTGHLAKTVEEIEAIVGSV